MALYNFIYTADEACLPANPPTVHEINSADDILSNTSGRKVVGVGPHVAVNYGVKVDALEGKTMLFLAQSSLIPVPRVYAVIQDAAHHTTCQRTFIIMERIKGPTLQQEWPQMDITAKEVVATQLRNIFGEMRKIPSPGGYCSIDHAGLPDGMFWTDNPSNPFAGPFDSEAQLNEALISK